MTQGLIKNFKADTAIPRFTVVKQSGDGTVAIATSVNDVPLGVTDSAPDLGERVDVVLTQYAQVLAGTALAAGVPVTVDGSGRAVAAAPAAGVNTWAFGITRQSATNVAGYDVIWVELIKQRLQG
jgi:hypothetical protein